MAEAAVPPQGGSDTRHHGQGGSGSWVIGIVLILLGAVFLLEQSGYIVLTGNWWALFIYIAAVGSFANAWRSYHSTGEFGNAATGSLVWGLVFTVVATIFLFNLLWDTWWPAILIAVGVGILAGYFLRSRTGGPGGPGGTDG